MRYFLYIIFIVFVSCKAPENTLSQSEKTIQKETPQIGFYFFEAKKSGNDPIQIRLAKQKIVKGKIKGFFETTISSNKWALDKWIVTFVNVAKQPVMQLQISNPLIEELEFVNEDGNFEKRTIYHDKKEFVIRIPYEHSIKTITFEQITKDNNTLKPTLLNQIQL